MRQIMRSVRQWEALVGVLKSAGATIRLITPVQGLPDMVFTANAALIYKDLAVVSRFRPLERRGEQTYCEKWFTDYGFDLFELEDELFFEGAGDALFCGDRLWAGYLMRSDASAQQSIGLALSLPVMPLELVDPYFYHLDTCFCPLAEDAAMYFPAAFDDYGRKVLQQTIGTLIEIEEAEARCFAANAVVVGQTVITNVGCPQLHRSLKAEGFEPVETPLTEFVKAGGSAKCLTLRLDGEDAAAWRTTA